MIPEQSPSPDTAAPDTAAPDATALDVTAPGSAEEDAAEAAQSPAAPKAGRAGRRSLAVTLLLSVVGATLMLVAAGQTWVSGQVQAQGVTRTVVAHGGEVSGVPGAMALVGLASVVAVFAVRGKARQVLGGLVVLAGAAAAGAAVTAALGSGSRSLDDKAARSVGLSDVAATSPMHTAWPWAAALGGALLLVAGLLTVVRGGAWPGMSARYEAPTGKGAAATPKRRAAAAKASGPQTPADLWKALDRGEDPTAS